MESEDCKIFHMCQESDCSYITCWDFALNHHAKTHHQDKKYGSRRNPGFDCRSKLEKLLCDSWDYESSFKVNFDSHLRSHYDWTSQKILRAPKDEELLEIQGRCEKCGFESASHFLLQVHIFHCSSEAFPQITFEKVEDIIKVEESTILTPNNNNLPDPIDCVNEKGVYQCNFCEYTSKHRQNISRHQKSKHLSVQEIEWINCKYCDHKSKRSDYMKLHVRNKHESEISPGHQQSSDGDPRKYRCDNCNFRTHRKHGLAYHMLAFHTAEEAIKYHRCSQCPYRTKKPNDLRRHLITKHTAEEAVLWMQCDRCSYKTKTSDNYRKHLKSAHGSKEEIKWFHCAHCEYKSKRKRYLQQHITLQHLDPKCLKCNICGFSTRMKGKFRRHLDDVHHGKVFIKNEVKAEDVVS